MSGATRCNPFADRDSDEPCWLGNVGCLAQERADIAEAYRARENQRLEDLLAQTPVPLSMPLPVVTPVLDCSFSSAFSAGFPICATAPIPQIGRAFSQAYSPGFE